MGGEEWEERRGGDHFYKSRNIPWKNKDPHGDVCVFTEVVKQTIGIIYR